MKNTKSIIKKFIRVIYITCITIFIVGLVSITILHIKNPNWFAIDSCLDSGDVWDYEQNICRNDCLKWSKDFGCIKLTKEQIKMYDNCNQLNCITKDVYKAICLSNDKAWNLKYEECDFNFTLDKCSKLDNYWILPDICR